jgi:hypothetical protein
LLARLLFALDGINAVVTKGEFGDDWELSIRAWAETLLLGNTMEVKSSRMAAFFRVTTDYYGTFTFDSYRSSDHSVVPSSRFILRKLV